MVAIDPLALDVRVVGGRLELCERGDPVGPFDAVLPRVGMSATAHGLAVLRHMEALGTWALNPARAIALSRDKLASTQRLASRGVPVPDTVGVHELEGLDEAIEAVGGLPVVIKPREGTQGEGVVLAESMGAARSLCEAFRGVGRELLVQRFVAEAAGSDLRALVVDGKVVAAMRRTAAEGDFRANLHRGGSAEAVRLPREYRRAAVRAARLLGLRLAGADLLKSKDGPVVLEVNSSPGLEGIEAATGVDVAGLVLEAVEAGVMRRRGNRPTGIVTECPGGPSSDLLWPKAGVVR
jgi:ribosomal protein S6--L-glutamate ligase